MPTLLSPDYLSRYTPWYSASPPFVHFASTCISVVARLTRLPQSSRNFRLVTTIVASDSSRPLHVMAGDLASGQAECLGGQGKVLRTSSLRGTIKTFSSSPRFLQTCYFLGKGTELLDTRCPHFPRHPIRRRLPSRPQSGHAVFH